MGPLGAASGAIFNAAYQRLSVFYNTPFHFPLHYMMKSHGQSAQWGPHIRRLAGVGEG
jgi:hypothetical protein